MSFTSEYKIHLNKKKNNKTQRKIVWEDPYLFLEQKVSKEFVWWYSCLVVSIEKLVRNKILYLKRWCDVSTFTFLISLDILNGHGFDTSKYHIGHFAGTYWTKELKV